MAIDELTALVTPPAHPLESGSDERWDALQRELGMELPTDFRDFGRTYGSGWFQNESIRIYIYQPFSQKFREELQWHNANLSADKEYQPEYKPYEALPDPGGLLIWGSDVNGHYLYWKTQGSPHDWTVVTCDPRGDGWAEYPGPMTTFLANAFARRSSVALWPVYYFEQPNTVIYTASLLM